MFQAITVNRCSFSPWNPFFIILLEGGVFVWVVQCHAYDCHRSALSIALPHHFYGGVGGYSQDSSPCRSAQLMRCVHTNANQRLAVAYVSQSLSHKYTNSTQQIAVLDQDSQSSQFTYGPGRVREGMPLYAGLNG